MGDPATGQRLAHTVTVSGRHLESSAATDGTVTPADELFLNLDGTLVNSSLQSWRIEVCGIHSDESRNWVQLNLCGRDSYGVTLCADHLDPAPIRRMLADWLPRLSFASRLPDSCSAPFAV